MEYIRPFFCIRVGGFTAAEFILLTIILVVSTYLFKRNEKMFQIYYTEPKSNIPTDKFNKVLCEMNLSFNKFNTMDDTNSVKCTLLVTTCNIFYYWMYSSQYNYNSFAFET